MVIDHFVLVEITRAEEWIDFRDDDEFEMTIKSREACSAMRENQATKTSSQKPKAMGQRANTQITHQAFGICFPFNYPAIT